MALDVMHFVKYCGVPSPMPVNIVTTRRLHYALRVIKYVNRYISQAEMLTFIKPSKMAGEGKFSTTKI